MVGLFGGKISAGLSKRHSTCPKEHFRQKVFGLWAKNFRILCEKYRQGCPNCFHRVQRYIEVLKKLWKVINFTLSWLITGEESLHTEGMIFHLYYFTTENNISIRDTLKYPNPKYFSMAGTIFLWYLLLLISFVATEFPTESLWRSKEYPREIFPVLW